MRFHRLTAACCALLFAWPAVSMAAGNEEFAQRLRNGGHALMLRHALAPGIGDPAGFTLGDCRTQRNLDDVGRAQARRLGAWLRGQGITSAKVYTSQWCRCIETARLLGLGPVIETAALNSMHDERTDRDAALRALRRFISELPRDGGPVVLVSHQATIRALTGEPTGSGSGVLLRLDASPDGATRVGNMRFDEM